MLGYPHQALEKSREALQLSKNIGHSFSLVQALIFDAVLHQFRGRTYIVQERIEEVRKISREQAFPLWIAWGDILWGWSLSEEGQGEEGIAQIQCGIKAWQTTGAELTRPYFHTILAVAYTYCISRRNFRCGIHLRVW